MTTVASTTSTETTVVKTTDPTTVLLGPKPYNRFLGNPPIGKTPEEAFKDENNYDWLVEISAQPYADKVNKLEAEITQLQASKK